MGSPRLGELQYWAPASPVVSPLLSPPQSPGRAWLVGSPGSSDPSTPRASRPSHISWSRTEDWQQKKDRSHRRPGRGRLEEAGELLSRALPRLLVKSVFLSRTETTFTRSSLNTGSRRHKDGSARRSEDP